PRVSACQRAFTILALISQNCSVRLACNRYSLFFFVSDGDCLDLHSFPTRRSSDLDGRPGGRVRRRYRERQLRSGPWRDAERSARDRKSTRLNSSHVAISYAVFCLKKKCHHPSPPLSRHVPPGQFQDQ